MNSIFISTKHAGKKNQIIKVVHFTFVIPLLFGACSDHPSLQNQASYKSIDYLIFGAYAGECIGDCTHLFKIEDGKIYIDNVDYPFENITDDQGLFSHRKETITFKDQPLSEKYFHVAQRAVTEFPTDFYIMSEQEFGMPDAYDQGGIYLAVSTSKERKVWTIDPHDNFTSPKNVVEYKNVLISVFDEMNTLKPE